MRLSSLVLAGALLHTYPAVAAAPPPPLAPGATPAPPPPAPYPPGVRFKTHSPALIGGGIALLALGGLSIAGAATAIIVERSGGHWGGALTLAAGFPLLVHAAGCFAGGIPMIVIGHRQIPVVPFFSVGPTTTLRWAF